MTIALRPSPLAFAAALACLTVALPGCDDSPTNAVVENAFPALSDAGAPAPMTVYKVWWITTLFPDPVARGEASQTERTIPGDDYAYALLAPGWSPSDGEAPSRLIAVKSARKLSVAEHGLLHIVVSDDTFVGDCAAGHLLPADDARMTVERIFPGDFAGTTYDPATCAMTRVDVDGGDGGIDEAPTSDAGSDTPRDAGSAGN